MVHLIPDLSLNIVLTLLFKFLGVLIVPFVIIYAFFFSLLSLCRILNFLHSKVQI